MAILNNSNAISSGGYDINNSLRFRSSASAYLSRTFTTPTNNKIFTWSGWVKRGQISTSTSQNLFRSGGGGSTTGFRFSDTAGDANMDGIRFFFDNGASGDLKTTQIFRDPSAWYHLVVAVDTTQATAANRVKMYVNGNQITAFGTATYPAQNYTPQINSAIAHSIGIYLTGPQEPFDGYMTEINFVDGQQLAPSSFGETDTTTGSWKPKAYTGTYGTNGFYLKFSDIATTSGSNAGLGKDFSGNTNYWTTNNISVTAGTTYDAMIDSPTLTSATVANYAVMNPLWKDGTTVIAQGNLDVSNGNYGGFSTLTIPTNSKFYAEFTVTATQGNQGVGILKAANAYSGVIGQADMFSSNSVTYYSTNGNKFVLGGGSTAYGSSWGTIGDVIGIAVDTVNNQITFYKNNTSQGVITGITSGIEWVFATGNQTNTGGGAWNFGQRPFSYTPPTGFVRLNTYNLPDSTIKKGNTVMDATLYSGTGSSQVIVNAGAFKPDFVWMKTRNVSANSNLIDSVRGVTKLLQSNSTGAEATNTDVLSSFNSNGFTVVSDYGSNYAGNTYVGWQWQAGQGSTSSNTSGSITSTVSVNTTAGFSIVTYTGNGTAGATIGHGLGVAPKLFIVKNRSNAGNNWPVYVSVLGNTGALFLSSTGAFDVGSSYWNNTSPTSSVFSVGGSSGMNGNTQTYVAYCWAEIAGFSKFGSYTGNGSTDGTFVYTGFRPRFILVKTTGVSDWVLLDTARDTYNGMQNQLFPNSSSAESSGTIRLDALSNGFKLRVAGDPNSSGNTYIYMAFAENPLKFSNAR
jgi:hypothetical protein